MMEWKEELQQHTKEAEKVVQGYLPEETGHQKLLIEQKILKVKGMHSMLARKSLRII